MANTIFNLEQAVGRLAKWGKSLVSWVMPLQMAPVELHPQGEVHDVCAAAARAVLSDPLTVDTLGRRFHVEWDPHAPVTPLGQLVFFVQFLAAGGLFADWVRACPLRFTSPNAPELTESLRIPSVTHLTSLKAGEMRIGNDIFFLTFQRYGTYYAAIPLMRFTVFLHASLFMNGNDPCRLIPR